MVLGDHEFHQLNTPGNISSAPACMPQASVLGPRAGAVPASRVLASGRGAGADWSLPGCGLFLGGDSERQGSGRSGQDGGPQAHICNLRCSWNSQTGCKVASRMQRWRKKPAALHNEKLLPPGLPFLTSESWGSANPCVLLGCVCVGCCPSNWLSLPESVYPDPCLSGGAAKDHSAPLSLCAT